MARTVKEGLPYFPLDTDFYTNRKIRRLLHSQGSQGLAVWCVVMAKIYSGKGYYLEFDEDTCFDIGDAVAVSEGAVQEIIKLAIKIRLFDGDIYERYGVLTSKGIQEQYLSIINKTKRKTELESKYLINSEEIAINSEEIAINSEEIAINSEEMQQSKVKESKVNKSKVKRECLGTSASTPTPNRKYGMYGNVLLTLDELEKLKAEFPLDLERRINRLSEYMESKGVKYKSHYATIKAWARKDKEQEQAKAIKQSKGRIQTRNYDFDDLEKKLLGR